MMETQRLGRRFCERIAVDDISLTVGDGEIVGFVGANGAGKTTTMRMIMGGLEPSTGQVLWNGKPATAADRRRFGYMPEERGLYPKQPVLGQLVYLGRLQGLSTPAARASATELLERFGLTDRHKDKLESLSLGNQQRVQIAAAMIASPRLLVLDEPFSGLDPTAVDHMATLLAERAAAGSGVLFSSHQLELVERLCDRLIVLAHGRVVASGTAEELRRSGPLLHRLTTAADVGWLRGLTWLNVVSTDTSSAIVQLDTAEDADRLLREALSRTTVYELSEIVPNLTDIFQEVAA
ncbi:ABC transporter ATP-binding protein [Actinomycetes bacterium M1A6_2h]